MIDAIERKSGFRPLTMDEMDVVSGGDGNDEIIVTAQLNVVPNIQFGGISLGLGGVGGAGSVASGISSGWSGFDISKLNLDAYLNSDIDGDGVPDNEDSNPYDPRVGGPIVVNGPPRLATNWEQLTLANKIDWLAAWTFYGGDDLFADIIAGTNLSGNNPNDPYASTQERLRRYGEAGKTALESALAPLSNLR